MKVWITKDGQHIPYDQLKLNHIYNIIQYALNTGFHSVYTSRSFEDNMDDVTIYEDCNNSVIHDMKQELKRRNITCVYYVVITESNKRITPVFESKSRILGMPLSKEHHKIVREYV